MRSTPTGANPILRLKNRPGVQTARRKPEIISKESDRKAPNRNTVKISDSEGKIKIKKARLEIDKTRTKTRGRTERCTRTEERRTLNREANILYTYKGQTESKQLRHTTRNIWENSRLVLLPSR